MRPKNTWQVNLFCRLYSQGLWVTAFRTILLGNINLLKEICLGQSGSVGRPGRDTGVRRIYCAKLEGRDSGRMTVTMYQGDCAEEMIPHKTSAQWRKHLAKYRHSNVMQLYGLMRTNGLHALVFHDGYRMDRRSPSFGEGFPERYNGAPLHTVSHFPPAFLTDDYRIVTLENVSLYEPNADAVIISTLNVDEYHELCAHSAMARNQLLTVPPQPPVPLGSIFFHGNAQPGFLFRIAQPVGLEVERTLHWAVRTWSDLQRVLRV
ncbi:hypothetical protein C8R44DRAFT_742818 [Mycena epipterygia]|nr:hypothetical protein C8R44DRAFT_742818 [Mycena epipterygia]